MCRNKLGEDLPIPQFIHLKIGRLNVDGLESLTTLELHAGRVQDANWQLHYTLKNI